MNIAADDKYSYMYFVKNSSNFQAFMYLLYIRAVAFFITHRHFLHYLIKQSRACFEEHNKTYYGYWRFRVSINESELYY